MAEAAPPQDQGSSLPTTIKLERTLHWSTLAALTTAAVAFLIFLYSFALNRFFTIDEYQWGHATWLVSKSRVPYRDFYEHHLPLGYVLHSVALPANASFTERALALRIISLAYVLVAISATATSTYARNRNPHEALLAAIVPASIGFGLMSAIDYRGDNWSAFLYVTCLCLIETNQITRNRWLSSLAGVLAACSVLMSQKAILLGGAAIGIMLVYGVLPKHHRLATRWATTLKSLEIPHARYFCGAAGLVFTGFLLVMAGFGQLGRMVEITIGDAIRHESTYPGFSSWTYIKPYLQHTSWSTGVLAAGVVLYLAKGPGGFWWLPTVVAVAGCLKIKAPYPYNFVLPSYLLGLCAVRAYFDALRRLAQRRENWRPLLAASFLPPLLIAFDQTDFVRHRTDNAQQLQTLRIIEENSQPEDVVISSEGGALFRPGHGYRWYHGLAHISMFHDYYENEMLEQLRESRALFWLSGVRSKQLPKQVLGYLHKHYVRHRGDLHVLGATISANGGSEREARPFNIVRAGTYYVSRPTPVHGRIEMTAAPGVGLRIDGKIVNSETVHLSAGAHVATLTAGAPEHRLSYLPPLRPTAGGHVGRHAALFEYD